MSEVDLAERGLNEALERGSQRIGRANAGVLISVAEALAWAYSLEEWHKTQIQDYYTHRDADTDGQVLAGLRYARNRVTHDLARIGDVTTSSGAIGTVPWGGGGGTWRWKPLSELPEPDPNFEDKPGKHWYSKRVECQPLLVPLYSARDFLLGLRHQP